MSDSLASKLDEQISYPAYDKCKYKLLLVLSQPEASICTSLGVKTPRAGSTQLVYNLGQLGEVGGIDEQHREHEAQQTKGQRLLGEGHV